MTASTCSGEVVVQHAISVAHTAGHYLVVEGHHYAVENANETIENKRLPWVSSATLRAVPLSHTNP